jgi:fatty acid synthase
VLTHFFPAPHVLSPFVQLALDAIREGQCDMAIVAAANVTLLPHTSVQFMRLGMLSADGKCKTFDATGMFEKI